MQNDNLLISKIQNKDEAALSELYDSYSPALYGVIIRIGKDEQEAQNIDNSLEVKAKELMDKEDIDGGLVGGASLEAESFAKIVKSSL